ncbi:MAG TPA: OmpA family protein, partial [Bacteroidota bacterium]|nr:OmpA family protein [Bacteroidota bacterium]
MNTLYIRIRITVLLALFAVLGTAVTMGQTPVGTKITNVVSMSSKFLDGRPGAVKTDTASHIVPPYGKYSLYKTATPSVVLGGDTVTFTLIIGDSTLKSFGRVVVVDTMPSAFTILKTSGGTVSGSVITWNIGNLAPRAVDTLTVTAKIQAGLLGGTQITNSAYATDSSNGRIRANAIVSIASRPNLILQKFASKDSLLPGDSLMYMIRVANTGNINFTQLRVTDTLPSQLSNITVSANAVLSNGVVTFVLDTLKTGAADTIYVKGRVPNTVRGGTIISNTVYSHENETPDKHAQVQTEVIVKISMPITKTVSKDTALGGDSLRYVIRYRNTGNVVLTNVVMRDTLPAMFSATSVSSPAQISGGIVTLAQDSLVPAAGDSIYISGVISASARGGNVLRNTAYLSSNQTPLAAAQATTVIETMTDFIISKVVSRDTVNTGDTLSYMIRIQNKSNVALTNVMLRDVLPIELIGVTLSSNWTNQSGTAVYHRDTLQIGQSDTMTISARLSPGAPDRERIVNTVYGQADQAPLTSAFAAFYSNVFVNDHSCKNILTAVPELVIGNGRASSVITAFLEDTLGHPKPDGTPVTFHTDYGIFSNGLNTIIHPTVNGYAIDSVRFLLAAQGIVISTVIVSSNDSNVCAAVDTIKVRFFPGAIYGIVVDRTTNQTVAGAVVDVFSSSDSLVGADTTIGDGKFLVPVPKTDNYRVTITVTDNFGQAVTVTSQVAIQVPGVGGNPPSPDKNAVSGTLYYVVSDQPIPIPNLEVTLTPLEGQKGKNNLGVKIQGTTAVIESTMTDSRGIYYFNDIPAGLFQVTIKHPTVSGNNTVVNVGNGEYVINTNIPVVLTPNFVFNKTGPQTAYIKDTVQYTLTMANNGTLGATNAVITDSLDPHMIYVSSSDSGVFTPANHLLIWKVAHVDSSYRHAFTVKVRFDTSLTMQRNYLVNRATLNTDQTTPLSDSAKTEVRLNPKLRIWKDASVSSAGLGDTVLYTINAGNTTGGPVDSLSVSDQLPAEVRFGYSVPAPTSYDSTTNTLTWWIDSLAVGQTNHYILHTTVRKDIGPGEHDYTNVAHINWREGFGSSDQDTGSHAEVRTTITFLSVLKTVQKTIVEIGDIVPYNVTVTNSSPNSPAMNVALIDRIPFGFKYLKGSSFRDSIKIADPTGDREIRWNLADTLKGGQSINISYRLVAGAGATESNGINKAQAQAKAIDGTTVLSNVAQAQVEVRLGVFSDHGLIVGKVFYDDNQNKYQDQGEVGVKGVELMMEDGSRIITGDDGKYSLPDVMPGDHVIRVREQSLPRGSSLELGYGEFAGQASSRFVKVPESGIARADFYLKRGAPPSMKLSQHIARLSTLRIQRISEPKNVMFIEDERKAELKLPGSNFEVGKAILRPEAYPTLKNLAEIMIQNEEQVVKISGHTDSVRIHTKEFPSNQELSEARANAVRDYLVNVEHIDAKRITTAGYGPTVPVAPNSTLVGRAANRRIELLISGTTAVQPRAGTTVVFKIPVSYEGTAPVTQIEVHDWLDT